MSRLTFTHIFVVLMLMAGLSALVLPGDFMGAVRGNVDLLLKPVSSPTQWIASWIHRSVSANEKGYPADLARKDTQIRDEVDQLRATVSVLTEELGHLQQQKETLDKMGPAGKFCKVFSVNFPDAGQKESLSISATSGDGVRLNMAVLTSDSLVGRIAVAGATASQVRLVTDRESWIKVAFRRFVLGPDGTYSLVNLRTEHSPVLQGAGNGRMYIMKLDMKEVQAAQLAEGDWVVLADDADWPAELRGMPVGRIEKIEPQAKETWLARITVRPRTPLIQLRQVMVMVK